MRSAKMRCAAAVGTLWGFSLGVVSPAWGAVIGTSSAQAAVQSDLTINHDALPCVVTDLAPQVDAQVAPGPELERGYVYFKAAGTEDFYYTPMKGPADKLEGTLPRPLPQTKAIDYKVRARDVKELTKETREYAPPVVPGNACKTKGMLVGTGGAGLTVGLTREGQEPVPPGFDKRDIAFIILFGGATVTLAQALAGAGGSASGGTAGGTTTSGAKKGGVSKGLLIGGAVVVAAGAAVAISNNSGGGSKAAATATATATPTRTATPQPTATPTAVPQFVAAVANWSGPGDVDVQILNAGNQSVGTNLPAGCESTLSRSESVLLQGAPAGTYRVMLSAKTCGTGTPSSIATVVSVQSNGAIKCPNSFLDVPVGGGPIQACSFTLP
jgi:hypothetical protein